MDKPLYKKKLEAKDRPVKAPCGHRHTSTSKKVLLDRLTAARNDVWMYIDWIEQDKIYEKKYGRTGFIRTHLSYVLNKYAQALEACIKAGLEVNK